MKKILLFWGLALITLASFSQTTLGPGDIAFLGVNTDGTTDADDNFAFILLKDIDAATQIIFTDRGWTDGVGFWNTTPGDGEFTWTSGSARSAGEVVILDFSALSPVAASFTQNGDQLFAIQGSLATPTFIAGLHFNVVSGTTEDGNWDGAATSNTTSALPDALTTGDTAIRLTGPGGIEQDNFQFSCTIASCPLSGTPEELRAIIHNPINWSSNNSTPFAGTVDPGFGTPTITPPTGSITIVLSSVPDDAQDFPFTLTRPGEADVNMILDDDTDPTRSNNFTVSSLDANDYDVSTMLPAGWLIDSIDDGAASTISITNGVTISLAQGEDVTVTFNVIPNPCEVSIDTQPQNPTVCEFDSLSLSVVASGTGTLSYQWQFAAPGSSSFNDVLTNSPTVQVGATVSLGANGNQYRVIVTSDNGTPGDSSDDCSVTSNIATLTVNPLPTVTFTAPDDLCVDAGPQTGLGGGTPAQGPSAGDSGVYSGPGVTDDGNGMTYSFDPVVAGVGVHEITYEYTDGNGCSGLATDEVEVFALPVLTFTALADLAVDAGVQTNLGGGNPVGGVYSGIGVTDNGDSTYDFDPSVTGVGTHTITYTYTNGNGCTNSASDDVEVLAAQPTCMVSIDTQPEDVSKCQFDSTPTPISVSASANGSLSYFWEALRPGSSSWVDVIPSANGNPQLTFTVVDILASGTQYRVTVTSDNGTPGDDTDDCSETSDAATLTINPLPTVTFTAPGPFQQASGVETGLGGGLPVGGVYSGSGVTDNGNGETFSFDTAFLDSEQVEVIYTYTDANGCTNFARDNINATTPCEVTIDTQPTDQTACDGGDVTFSVTASGTGTLSYRWGVWDPTAMEVSSGSPAGSTIDQATFSLSGTQVPAAASGTQFAVEITDDNGTPVDTSDDCSITSVPVTMTVNALPAPLTPQITIATCAQAGEVLLPNALGADEEFQVSTNGGVDYVPLGGNSYVLNQGPSAAMTLMFRTVNTATGCEGEAFIIETQELVCDTICGPLPSPWINSDIGDVGATGSACYIPATGTFEVEASGENIWNLADEFHFVYQELIGDGEIIARVVTQENTFDWAKAGVMMRNGLDASAEYGFMSAFPNPAGLGEAYGFQFREQRGVFPTAANNLGLTFYDGPPIYLRLVREGDTITGYASLTNGNWQMVASVDIPMEEMIYIGLAVTSHVDGVINTSTFDNVSVSGGVGPPCGGAGLNTYFADTDGDGFGDPNNSVQDCTAPSGFVADNTDCDDTNDQVYPGAPEICDGLDNDCNGVPDDGLGSTIEVAAPSGTAPFTAPVTNGEALIWEDLFPGITINSGGSNLQNDFTICNTGNCDLILTDAITATGFYTINQPSVTTLSPGSCTTFTLELDGIPCPEENPISTTVTIPNNTGSDDPFTFTFSLTPQDSGLPDSDGDGVSDTCDVCEGDDASGDVDGDGYCSDMDCNDNDASINPGTSEVCGDGIDNNCDGLTDEEDANCQGVTCGPVPAPWSNSDIGDVGAAGSACYVPATGTFEVAASGENIWNLADEFHFVYQELTGDGEIIARVVNQENTFDWAKAGIMMRNGLDAGAEYGFMTALPNPAGLGEAYAFQYRQQRGVFPTAANNVGLTFYDGPPVYLRLVREGDTIMGYASLTNGNWQLVGSIDIPMEETIYIGLAVTSHVDGTINTSTFDNVSVNGSAGPPCGGAGFTTFYADTDGDGFGDPGNTIEACTAPAGYVTDDTDCDDTNINVNPGAIEICDGIDNNCDGNTDEGFFGPIINQVLSSNVSDCVLSDGEIIIGVTFDPSLGVEYSIDGGNTWQPSSAFSNLATGEYNVFVQSLGGCLPVAYENNPVVIEGPDGACTAPDVCGPVPNPWVNSDIGDVGATGDACYNASTGVFEVTGSGENIWNFADEFHYVYQELEGDGEIVARVLSQENTFDWTKAGVMMRNGTDDGAEFAMMTMLPNPAGLGTAYAFQYRDVRGEYLDGSNNLGLTVVGGYPYYIRLVRTGNTITGYASTTNGNWQFVGSAPIAMDDTIQVGLAVTSHNDGVLNTSTFDDVSVTSFAAPRLTVNLNNMSISPNPANVSAIVSFEEPEQVEEILIFDMTGRVIQRFDANEIRSGDHFEMNVYPIPVGTYIVRAESPSGFQYNKQMVIKR